MSWAAAANSVRITIAASGISATLVDDDDMIIGESSIAAGDALVEFVRELWTLGFDNGAVSVHPGRGETHVYFVRKGVTE